MDNKDFINKLYIDPIQNLTQNKQNQNFKPKEKVTTSGSDNYFYSLPTEGAMTQSLPNLNSNNLMGNVIMQNWETKNEIPKDLPKEMIKFPIIMDRNKLERKKLELKTNMTNVNTREHIIKEGEKLILGTKGNRETTKTNYQTETAQTVPNKNVIVAIDKTENEEEQQILKTETDKESQDLITTPSSKETPSSQKNKNPKIIDFSTFNKHLFLRGNDFLYARRVGGPVDYELCTYQDINPRAKKSSLNQVSKGKKLPPLSKSKRNFDYITISKNTAVHYMKNQTNVYSIQEFIDNYEKFKQLMNISLFKNFRNAKLFDLWRRFFRKTKRQYNTEKLRKKFFLIDEHLRTGIFDIRKVIKEMSFTNIFLMEQSGSLLLNKFKEMHKDMLVSTEKKIEQYRSRIKVFITQSCNQSYLAYKALKKITLDDNISGETSSKEESKNNNNNNKKDEGANIQNFIKDAIPYAQDATRKTHYKKLLRYIRVMDYLFNEAKFSVINFSLEKLNNKFERLYQAYVHKYVDPPILITKILCMTGECYYNPSMSQIKEAIFDNFIQETIYTVIYRKSFIDPQEFPRYMSCFEEVFECSVDQNTNLNGRIKENPEILAKFNSIKENFENCHIELDKYNQSLKPILYTNNEYNKINFKQLEETATPDELKNLLENFQKEEKIIKALRNIVNIGIFEFQLDDLIDTVGNSPKYWLDKLKVVIPNVYITKVKNSINKLNNYLKNLSINPTDVETFIKLKKAVEECNKDKAKCEEEANDITDLTLLLEQNKDIKLQEYDNKLGIELKDITVKYDRKLDGSSYYIDNNIQNYRNDLKNEIKKFDEEISGMRSELNNETLNTYNEETFSAIGFLEENDLKIQKSVVMKEKYQKQEDDLEVDPTLKSNFDNLDALVYDQELKKNIWHSVDEFQNKSHQWEMEQVQQVNIPKMTELIDKWLKLCEVAIIDLENTAVPIELKKRVQVYQSLVPVITACQNPNIQNVSNLLNYLLELLKLVDYKLDDPMITVDKIMNINDIFEKIPEIEELNRRANEENRLKNLIKEIQETFYPRKIPVKLIYDKNDFNREFEFVEENLKMIYRIYLNQYVKCILKDLDKLNFDFKRYQNFLINYVNFQDYVIKSEGIMDNNEFAKEMPIEYKKLLSENLKRNLLKNVKDYPTVQRFLEHAYDKTLNIINSIIQNFEQNYRAISIFLDKKRKETPKFYLLNNDDLIEIYQEKESNEVKRKIILKLYPYIKSIEIGQDTDENMTLTTIENEEITFKYTKSTRSLKDLIDVLDTYLIKKIKDLFKGFKKEYELSFKAKTGKKPKEVIYELITNKDNLLQSIFNCLYYIRMDSLEKSLFNADEAFDKLFDLYNEIKDDKIVEYIKMLKDPKSTLNDKRILTNIISLENYAKNIIEVLIREDVVTATDFNFYKLINPKIENDSYILHFLNFSLEYGYDYVGLQNNFIILPETERAYVSLANSILLKRPFEIYSLNESGKNETLKIFAGLLGKRINYINTAETYTLKGFNHTLFGNLKTGCWLALENTENLKFEDLEILANRIIDVYRIIHSSGEEDIYNENGEKYACKLKQLNLFLIRNIRLGECFNNENIPNVVKNYFRQVGLPVIDSKIFLENALNNLSIENYKEISNKIIFCINFINSKIKATNKKYIQISFINKIVFEIIKKIDQIQKDNVCEIIRNILRDLYKILVNPNENELIRKLINEEFNMKEYEDNIIDETEQVVIEAIQKEISLFKFGNQNFEDKIKVLYNNLDNFNNFILVGPPISGKTQIMLSLSQITKNLNALNNTKYSKILQVKIYSKSQNANDLFCLNKIEKAYKFNNNFFYNMITLFNNDNKEILNKLNNYYYDIINKNKEDLEEEVLDPEKIKDKFNKVDEDGDLDDDDEGGALQTYVNRDSSDNNENILKAVIFDGEIDDTWIEFINNIYSDYNFLNMSDGNNFNLNNNFKLFFECQSLKNTNPTFLTKNFILNCDYSSFSWDNILYSWIENNKKITCNSELRNYIRGLFENYFPRIWDFIVNNKFKNINISENYSIKTLINIFDSVLPLFNFEDIRIGRKNFNVTPKIEIIKKCTLSIFIFSCAWTMEFLSNFVIKTKIEKLISDIFKADDLKGPIFDYYIDETTNDFELWSNLLNKHERYTNAEFKKGETFHYNKLFIHTLETVPYQWLVNKFIEMGTPFFYNGKENSGKTMLLNSLLDTLAFKEMSIKKIKFLNTYNTKPLQIENYLNDNLDIIKRDKYGDKFGKKLVLFIDDLNLNLKTDSYNSSYVLEYLRGLNENKFIYDTKQNIFKYLEKFCIGIAGNVSSYNQNENFDRFLSKFVFITQVQSEEFYVNIFKPSLEFHLRSYIPNTSGITATQYIQVGIKLNQLLNECIPHEPKKIHYCLNIRDLVRTIQSFHLYSHKLSSEYPEYIKKLFFYESSIIYEGKINKKEDVQLFRDKICEAYSSVFKQDKVTSDKIFSEDWNKDDFYIYCKDFDNFNNAAPPDAEPEAGSTEPLIKYNPEDHIYLKNKSLLKNYIREKVDVFYRSKDIKNNNLIKLNDLNIDNCIKILRVLENYDNNLILVGKENTGKSSLFKFAAYLQNIEVIDIATYNNINNTEIFVKDIVIPTLTNCVFNDKKTCLYVSYQIKDENIFEIITKLYDTKEIVNNFVFITQENYGLLKEEEIIERLYKNLSFCIDILPKNTYYREFFNNNSFICKNSQILFIHSWKENELKNYLNIKIEKLQFNKENVKEILPDVFYNIYNLAKDLTEEFSKKINLNLICNQSNFSSVCEFYSNNYNKYKEILSANQKKYNDVLESLEKSKILIENTNKQIEESTPSKIEMEKNMEEKKKLIAQKQKEKNQWRSKKQDEEKIVTNLSAQKKEKQATFDGIIQPFKDIHQKALNQVNKISPGDLTEIKNTWDGLNFGKFLLTKIFELLGESNLEWDNIKKNLDIKIIRNFANINAIKLPDNLINTVKEVTSHPDFTSGEKYVKPFRTCGVLCDYFLACKKYFDEVDNQKEILDEIEKLKNDIDSHNATIKEYIKNVTVIDEETATIEKNISDLDTKKFNINSHLQKLEGLKKCFEEFIETTNPKINILQNKKNDLDIILNNFDFYLVIMSSFIFYAGVFNKSYREKFKQFLYSLSSQFEINDIKDFPIYKIFLFILDATGDDAEFCSSLSQYNEFLCDNFMIMYILNNKIPYILDSNRMAKDLISQFLETKNPKGIVNTVYNDTNEIGEMFDKIESSMKNGNILFIENVEENIYNILINLIQDKFTYNAEKGLNNYVIRGKNCLRNKKFKLYLIKSKNSSKINNKVFSDCILINFSVPSDVIQKQIMITLANEQDPITYQQINKLRTDISKDEQKLLETENKITKFGNQFDLTGNLEKLENNQNNLERYKIEVSNHTLTLQTIKNNNIRVNMDISELTRYKLISRVSSKIYKWCYHFFNIDDNYMITIEFFANLIKDFYRNKFGIYKDLVGKRKEKKIPKFEEENEENEDEENEDNDEEMEKDDEEENIPKKQETAVKEIPTFEKDNLLELVLYLYNKLNNLYANNEKKFFLLLLLFYIMKERDEIPSNYKKLLRLVQNVLFSNNIDEANYNEESPISSISKKQWNALKQINDNSAYIFSIVIDNIENNKEDWDDFLNDLNPLLSNLTLFDEDLNGSISPFIKFLFFSIVKPSTCDSLVNKIINDIIKSEEDSDKKDLKYEITLTSLNKEIFKDINETRKPILFVHYNNDDIALDKEIKDYFLPELKSKKSNEKEKKQENNNENKEEGGNNQQTQTISSGEYTYKEIIPTKIELNNNEVDLIHNSMKNGGILIIKNANVVKDSVAKIIDEIKDPNTILNEKFKLILDIEHNQTLSTNYYENCIIVNRNINILTQIKEYILDLINTTNSDTFNIFMNNPSLNSSSYYMKKLYVYITIIHAVLVQYCTVKNGVFKIPIEFRRKDYFSTLQFVMSFMGSQSEDKLKELSNNDNLYGFTYDSLIKIILDVFVSNRMIYSDDVARLSKVIKPLFDEEGFLSDKFLFRYKNIVINNIEPEKVEEENKNENDEELINQNNEVKVNLIKKEQLIHEFEKINNEEFYKIMFAISGKILRKNAENQLNRFYNVIISGKMKEDENEIITDKISLNFPEILNTINEMKSNLPDPLSTNEGNPALFKINKLNDYFNPMDKTLKKEIKYYNRYLTFITNEIKNINGSLKGEINLTNEYYEIYSYLNKKLLPPKWKIFKTNKNINIEQWKKQIKKAFEDINIWIKEGCLNLYDVSLIINKNIFFDNLPMYFLRKNPTESKITPEKVIIKYSISKYNEEDLKNEEIINKIKEEEHESIYITGIKIPGFDCEKLEEKNDVIFTENDFDKNGSLLPVIEVSYTIEEEKEEKKENEEEEEEDEEEEEESNNNQEEDNKNQNAEVI